jgi:hypothetical protein
MRKIFMVLLLVVLAGVVGASLTPARAADVIAAEIDNPSGWDNSGNVEIIGVEDKAYYLYGLNVICDQEDTVAENNKCTVEVFDGDSYSDTKRLAYRPSTYSTDKPIPEGTKLLFQSGITIRSYSEVVTAIVFYAPVKD